MAIILDTETTGLLKSRLAPNDLQPHLIEIYAAKFDEETFEIIDEFESFVKPIQKWGEQIFLEDPKNKMGHICKITGIYDHMLDDALTFKEIAEDLFDFFEGEDLAIAHNVMFDLEIVRHNLLRIERPDLIHDFVRKDCTVEMSFPIKNKRLKLGQLYELATGAVMEVSHRAKADVLANLECYRWLKSKNF